MSERIYPYRTLPGDVGLQLMEGHLDDADWPKTPYIPDRRIVDLQDVGKRDWKRATFRAEITLSSDRVAELNASGAQVRVLLIIQCANTYYRETVKLHQGSRDANVWQANFDVEKENFHGTATIHALVAGTVDGRPNRYLSTSENWTLIFDEPDSSPLTGSMTVTWEDFDKPSKPHLKMILGENRHHSLYLDLVSNPPKLFLNKSDKFRGLTFLLEDRKRVKSDRPLHNAERISIARSTWMALFNTSIASVIYNPDEEPEWPAEDWKRVVLQKILSKIYPFKSDSELLKEAVDGRTDERAGDLQSAARAAIDEMIKAGRLLSLTLAIMADNYEQSDQGQPA